MRRFGLSNTQIEELRHGENGYPIYTRLKSTGEKLLALGMVKRVSELTGREKDWRNRRIRKLVRRVMVHLKAGRIDQAHRLLEGAVDQKNERDHKVLKITRKGLRVLAKIGDGESEGDRRLYYAR